MKTKKVRVRAKDLHHGMILYIVGRLHASNIDVVRVVGKPYITRSKITGVYHKVKLEVKSIYGQNTYHKIGYLGDIGIMPYDMRRCFRKLKQAQAYVKHLQLSPHYKDNMYVD